MGGIGRRARVLRAALGIHVAVGVLVLEFLKGIERYLKRFGSGRQANINRL